MPGPEELASEIAGMVTPGSHGNLLAQGQSRSVVWERGVVPDNGPNYEPRLTYNLMSYAFGLAANALALLSRADEDRDDSAAIALAFERAAEALEAVLRNGNPEADDQAINTAIAAMCYHLAGYSARAYSLVDKNPIDFASDPTAYAMSRLMLRDLEALSAQIASTVPALIRLIDSFNESDGEGSGPAALDGLDEDEAPARDPRFDALDLAFLQAISVALTGIDHGDHVLFTEASELLSRSASLAADNGFVLQWWMHRLAAHLIDGLWGSSLHARIPTAPAPSDSVIVGVDEWQRLRDAFITRLRAKARAEVELWPSQLPGARAVLQSDDDLVLSMPTSAGKTRIAELAILRTLARGRRVVFVAPLRALSAQTERNLTSLFVPLGHSVTSLYGAVGATPGDWHGLVTSDIVVATPEKFDFALRNDASLLDDVGLIVFDEGHMIGPDQRQVRYEAQIQRLLNRSDAAHRRVLCLSAVLPDGDALLDFADWFTGSGDSGLIRTEWTPTRRRFGTVLMTKGGAGRMELTVGEEKPFVPALFTAGAPSGRRRTHFPNDQAEMTMATAMALVDREHSVLIYSPRKKSVLALAKRIPRMHKQGFLSAVPVADQVALDQAIHVAEELFGTDDAVTVCLRLGIGVHHGSLPTQFRHHIERLIHENALRMVIASPTLAQGINLSATTVVFHGIDGHHGGSMPTADFLNVIGRAGRAFADVEGLVLFPVFDEDPRARRAKLRRWGQLQMAASEHTLRSGLVEVVRRLVSQVLTAFGTADAATVIEYLLNQREIPVGVDDDAAAQMETLVALVDVALLSLIGDEDLDDDAEAVTALDRALADSLWSRTIAQLSEDDQRLYPEVLKVRAGYVWQETTAAQRRGMFLAGVGMQTETLLAAREEELRTAFDQATDAINANDPESAIAAITVLARALFTIPPFQPKVKPEGWESILERWLSGHPVPRPDAKSEENYAAYDFLEESVGFNLVWGIEAVRARLEVPAPDPWASTTSINWVALAAQTGSIDRTAMVLLQAGLPSRSVARAVSEDLHPPILSVEQLDFWLYSAAAQQYTAQSDKLTSGAQAEWSEFVRGRTAPGATTWASTERTLTLQDPYAGQLGAPVRLVPGDATVRSSDFEAIGKLDEPFDSNARFWRAWTSEGNSLRLEEWD